MASNKPEINLEISSGTFRVPTDEAILNITVIGDGSGTVTRVVEKIVDEEKGMPAPDFDQGFSGDGDDYYKKVSNDIYHDIGNLAKSLSGSMSDIPAEDRKGKRAELDEAGEKIDAAKAKLREIVTMTESATMEILDQVEKVQDQTGGVRELLLYLKDHKAFAETAVQEDGEEADNSIKQEINEVKGEIERALAMLAAQPASASEVVPDEPAAEVVVETPTEGKTRYMFDLDVIFQTMYELCTNETVKDHITDAREKAGEIINLDEFINLISEKVTGLEPDSDNFLVVPLSDILGPLSDACNDKSIQNLMKNMDKNQASIFLDQSLPLEMPEIEQSGQEEDAVPEVEAVETADEAAPAAAGGEVPGILAALISRLDELADKTNQGFAAGGASGSSGMSIDDQQEIFNQIEKAFNLVSGITVDSSKITEVLSFQDLSGQQIMKIIKLLTDFQVQLLGIVVSFGSQLKRKEEKPAISVEESKALAQEDVDRYMEKVAAKDDKEEDDDGMLDQDAVNEMLEEMGF